MINLKLFLVSFVTFLILDAIWLGVISKNFYAKNLSDYLTNDIVWPAAIIFYLLFNIGLIVFVILPAIEENSYITLIMYALLYGLVTFSTYDLTNLATIKNWPVIVTIVDIMYGMFVAVVCSLTTFYLHKYLV